MNNGLKILTLLKANFNKKIYDFIEDDSKTYIDFLLNKIFALFTFIITSNEYRFKLIYSMLAKQKEAEYRDNQIGTDFTTCPD